MGDRHPLEMEFLSLIDSFNMVKWMKDPTHTHGHTLDLVLSHGFSITDALGSYLLSFSKCDFSLKCCEFMKCSPTIVVVYL